MTNIVVKTVTRVVSTKHERQKFKSPVAKQKYEYQMMKSELEIFGKSKADNKSPHRWYTLYFI